VTGQPLVRESARASRAAAHAASWGRSPDPFVTARWVRRLGTCLLAAKRPQWAQPVDGEVLWPGTAGRSRRSLRSGAAHDFDPSANPDVSEISSPRRLTLGGAPVPSRRCLMPSVTRRPWHSPSPATWTCCRARDSTRATGSADQLDGKATRAIPEIRPTTISSPLQGNRRVVIRPSETYGFSGLHNHACG
jgi:hypothetical protein